MEAGLMKGDRMPGVSEGSLPFLSEEQGWSFLCYSLWESGELLEANSLAVCLPDSPGPSPYHSPVPAQLSYQHWPLQSFLSRICSGKLRFARSALQTLDQELSLCPHFWHRNEGCWFLSLSRSELIRLSGTFSHLLCLSGNCKQTEK